MRSVNAHLLSSVCLLADGNPGPCPCFADVYALVPRVLKSCVAITRASFEPGTAASATTRFPRFRDGAAFGAYRTDGRRRRSFCWVFQEGIDRSKPERRQA